MTPTNHDLRQVDSFAISRRGSVLLVDEDRADLCYYGEILEAFGCRVPRCVSYEEGVGLLDSAAFDLIVVSQGSPSFEGRSVLERANQIDRGLPVLVVARCLDMPCYLEAMQLGAVDYLAEPVTVQELGRAVDAHLRLRTSPKGDGLRVSSRQDGRSLSV
jgi:two-component system C4-dicarboxylate transport response regulator DctD